MTTPAATQLTTTTTTTTQTRVVPAPVPMQDAAAASDVIIDSRTDGYLKCNTLLRACGVQQWGHLARTSYYKLALAQVCAQSGLAADALVDTTPRGTWIHPALHDAVLNASQRHRTQRAAETAARAGQPPPPVPAFDRPGPFDNDPLRPASAKPMEAQMAALIQAVSGRLVTADMTNKEAAKSLKEVAKVMPSFLAAAKQNERQLNYLVRHMDDIKGANARLTKDNGELFADVRVIQAQRDKSTKGLAVANAAVGGLRRENADLRGRLEKQDIEIAKRDAEIAECKAEIAKRDAELADTRANTDCAIADMRAELARLHDERIAAEEYRRVQATADRALSDALHTELARTKQTVADKDAMNARIVGATQARLDDALVLVAKHEQTIADLTRSRKRAHEESDAPAPVPVPVPVAAAPVAAPVPYFMAIVAEDLVEYTNEDYTAFRRLAVYRRALRALAAELRRPTGDLAVWHSGDGIALRYAFLHPRLIAVLEARARRGKRARTAATTAADA